MTEGWRDIATAPRDGRGILIGWDDGADDAVRVAFWDRDLGGECGWFDAVSGCLHEDPTHWQPRPAPPEPAPPTICGELEDGA